MAPKKFHNPFHGVVDMITEMNRISDTMSTLDSGQAGQVGDRERGFSDAWSPPTDILARGDDLIIRCEVPGIREEDVSVSFNHGVLSISGERHRDEEQDVVYYTSERYMGTFRRRISLPDGVDDGDIEASYEEGLLTVTVRGGANAKGPKRIAVRKRKRGQP